MRSWRGLLRAAPAGAAMAPATALTTLRRSANGQGNLMNRPEQEIQLAVIQHLRLRAPKDCFYFHVPNQRKQSPYMGALYKRLGVLSGVPDICLLHEGRFHGLELKAPGGRSSENQLLARANIDAAGGYASEAIGVDRAIGVLQAWGILPR